MKPGKNIENLIKEFDIDVNPKMDRQILDELRGMQAKSDKSERRASVIDVGRIIMQSKITKYAMAAIIMIAVLIGINPFGGSIDMTSVAFADVRNAFLAKSWVHLLYDNDTESWYNLETGDHGHTQLKSFGESFVYINRLENLRWRYTPADARHIEKDRPAVYNNDIIPNHERQTAWDTIVGHWEKIADNGGSEYYDVEIHDDTLDGNTTLRFDIYRIDALDRKLLTKQLWVDPETRLPVKIQEKLTSRQQKDQNREYITGIFSYPDTGPVSIYDLGVPKDLPIAKSYNKVSSPSVKEIFDTAKQYCQTFPKRCRAVIWQNDYASGMVDVVYRDGEKIRFNHYSTVGQIPTEHPLNLPTNVDGVLEWAETQPPLSIYLDDEKKSYHRSHHPAFEDLRTPKTRVTRSWRRGLPQEAHFIEEHWVYSELPPERFGIIEDAPENLKNYIGIRKESGTIRRDYYIDPERDYIRVRWIWWVLRDGEWQKQREYVNVEMRQLPTGHWYETKRKLIQYPNPEKGYSRHEENYMIDIELLNEDDFPLDTFNGEKLLDNAEIETY